METNKKKRGERVGPFIFTNRSGKKTARTRDAARTAIPETSPVL